MRTRCSDPFVELEIEAVAKDEFSDQVIRDAGHTHPKAEIDLPLRSEVQVDRRNNLMLLLGNSIKSDPSGRECTGPQCQELKTQGHQL